MSLLPNSIPLTARRTRIVNSAPHVAIYCANCGCDGGWVPEADVTDGTGFAFYLCIPCAEKWAPLAGTMMIPDEEFWRRSREAQIEREGRELSAIEIVEALKDGNHYLSKLVRDRRALARQGD